MNNLKYLRISRNVSQTDMAKTLGITRVELSKLENGWYTKAPRRVQAELTKIFGPEWTFEALMLLALAPSAPPFPGKQRRSRSKSAQGEKRAAA